MNISGISVSRRDVWRTCTQQYKYKYHLKLEPEDPEPIHFAYGSILHKIAEVYVANRGDKSLNEITESVMNGEMPIKENKNGTKILAPKLPAAYVKSLPSHLKSIQSLCDQIGTDGETEYSFKYDLDPPYQKYITGVIDRVIIKDNKCWIIDYKTTKKGMWQKKNVREDLQLRCYSRVVQKEFNIPAENISAALYYLDGGKIVAAKFSSKSLIDAELELLDVYRQIEDMPPENAWGNVGDHCGKCDYKKICPFYRIS